MIARGDRNMRSSIQGMVLALAVAAAGCSEKAPPAVAEANPPLGRGESVMGWNYKPLPTDPRQRLLARFDANGDGKLDGEERAAIKADVDARRAVYRDEDLYRYDANGDGRLDPEERKAAAADRKRARKVAHALAVKKYDVDGDGDLDAAERARMREETAAWLAEKRQQALSILDRNRDGVVDDREIVAFRAEQLRKRRERDAAQRGQ